MMTIEWEAATDGGAECIAVTLSRRDGSAAGAWRGVHRLTEGERLALRWWGDDAGLGAGSVLVLSAVYDHAACRLVLGTESHGVVPMLPDPERPREFRLVCSEWPTLHRAGEMNNGAPLGGRWRAVG